MAKRQWAIHDFYEIREGSLSHRISDLHYLYPGDEFSTWGFFQEPASADRHEAIRLGRGQVSWADGAEIAVTVTPFPDSPAFFLVNVEFSIGNPLGGFENAMALYKVTEEGWKPWLEDNATDAIKRVHNSSIMNLASLKRETDAAIKEIVEQLFS